MQQAHDSHFPQARSGSFYPTNHVVCVIDDLTNAQMAVEALKDAGHDSNDIHLFSSNEALMRQQELEANRTWLQRFFSSFQSTTAEGGADIYPFEARQGHHILYVRSRAPEDVDRISDLMEQFHAHTIKFFSRWYVADLPPQHMCTNIYARKQGYH